ncbi:hypothetical protein HDV00_007446 [Rhizophlyctis rosea]|nr:hypothetical protein HDV00_007446 [Rhizophlyctis rosea]
MSNNPPAASTTPPTDWQSCWDSASQAWYWWNTVTGETSWDDPSDPGFEEKRAKSVTNSQEATEQTGTEDPKQPSPSSEASQPTDKPVEKSATDASESSTNPDYYNSADYYNWYYSYYGQQQPPQPPPQATSEFDQLLDTIDGSVKKKLDEIAPAPVRTAHSSAQDVIPDWVGEGSAQESLPATTSKPVGASTPGKVDYSDYTVSGSFDVRTGRFRNTSDPRFAAPDLYFDQASKAARQMNFYFNYDQYQEERAAERMAMEAGGGPIRKEKKLTKKELEFYKQRKKEKKMASFIAKYAD